MSSQVMIEFHEIAELFPLMQGKEFEALVTSIKTNGLREPILLYEGRILDGRNRYNACLEASIEPRFEDWQGDDPWEFVWDTNAERRNISQTQKACIFAVKQMKRAEWLEARSKQGKEANKARSELAKAQPRTEDGLHFDRSIELPVAVSSDTATGKLIERTRDKVADEIKTSPATAGKVMAMANDRMDLVEKVAQGEMSFAEAKRQRNRDETPEPPEDKYRVLYADPPWEYNDSGLDNYGPAERHYPTMSTADLCKLAIKEIAKDNAVLFLWVTSPLLEDAFKVIKAWEFKYKTSFVWDKVKHNFGHYNSVRHEFLLICTRGSCTPDSDKKFDSVQTIERSDKHSEKPEKFRQIIDTLYMHGKRIELFARSQHEGWDVWGNEAETDGG